MKEIESAKKFHYFGKSIILSGFPALFLQAQLSYLF